MTARLELNNLSAGYDGQAVISDISLVLGEGEIGCLTGPSGCGKTTLLRAVAGFIRPQAGEVRMGGMAVSRCNHLVPVEARRVGMVFQDFALFPHLDVAANIGFGLKGRPRSEQHQRVSELAEMLDIVTLLQQYPHQLSGGQQQRVALARALAPRPQLMLLDEPFSSMDVELREDLAREVGRILRRDRVTTVMVTHNQFEAFAMADRVGVMQAGRLVQWDTPFELYHRPASRFVADFIGEGVLLPGRVLDEHHVETELGVLEAREPLGISAGMPVEVLVRPDDIIHDDDSPSAAVVVEKAFRGAEFLYTLALESGARLLSLVPSHHNHPVNQAIGIRADIEHLVVFPRAIDDAGGGYSCRSGPLSSRLIDRR
ncbi:MAG: ABC transporter ATP-binding protein [Gammaproteobacteria bacterium]|nr:ABC transporter ATP-binding protein [Gammaproteobacteria bacterium]